MESGNGRKLSRSNSGLRMIPESDDFACPFAINEPTWVADKESKTCKSCKKSFDFLTRKHHCRRCGGCFCDRCSHYLIPLKRMYFVDPVRHCYDCALLSKSEEEFYGKSLKILCAGNDFSVSGADDDDFYGDYTCHLSQDNRSLQFVAVKRSSAKTVKTPALIILTKVNEVKFIANKPDVSASTHTPSGFHIKYTDENDSSLYHKLQLKSIDKKSSLAWLASLQKAIKILFEAKHSMIIQ